jgi:predicted SprT family Zn-dependent metalloprotease
MGCRKPTLLEFLRAEGLAAHVVDCIELLAHTTHGEGIPDVTDRSLEDTLRYLEIFTVTQKKMVGRGGHFRPARAEIGLTSLTMSPEQRTDTILHEVAHLLDWGLFDGRNHEATWQLCAVTLGCKPDRKFSDEPFRASVKEHRQQYGKIVARCASGCGFEVIRLRRSRRNWHRFTHRGCPRGKGYLENVD